MCKEVDSISQEGAPAAAPAPSSAPPPQAQPTPTPKPQKQTPKTAPVETKKPVTPAASAPKQEEHRGVRVKPENYNPDEWESYYSDTLVSEYYYSESESSSTASSSSLSTSVTSSSEKISLLPASSN